MNKLSFTTSILSMHASPEAAYKALIAQRKLTEDAAQYAVLSQLQLLHDELLAENKLLKLIGRKRAASGIYIWGSVGRGKSMLMDIFYNSLPFKHKRRDHFHAFMLDIHHTMHALRKKSVAKENAGNLVADLAKEIADSVRVLCLDEFQVTDITDAMLLAKLFTTLVKEGVIVVATSNRPPEMLYQGGLQREQFLPFIDLVVKRFTVLELASPADYRLQQLKALRNVYFTPLGAQAEGFIKEVTASLGHGMPPEKRVLEVQGRSMQVDMLAGNTACFSFHDLCEKPLGASDYLEIACLFHTVILTDIPALSIEKRNEAKRFVTLIDALYEHKVKLICTAAAQPEALYPAGDGNFEFARTVSRLHEMQSEQYLKASHIA